MAKCEYKSNFKKEYVCERTALEVPDKDCKKRCIFHSTSVNKNVEEFYNGFKRLYDSGEHNFCGFVFPRGFNFKSLKDEKGSLEFIDADFSEAEFLCNVYFCEAKFTSNGITDFNRAKFSSIGWTDFRYAEFLGDGKTSFHGAKFTCKKGTDFRWAKFFSVDGTSFSNASFFDEKGINFGRAQFSSKGLIDFKYAEFSEECKVRFLGETFCGETEADFRNLNFENPDKVNITFDDVNLNLCRFLGTDLEKIKFKQVYWNGRKYKSKSYRGRVRIYDERFQYRARLLRKFESFWFLLKKGIFEAENIEEIKVEKEGFKIFIKGICLKIFKLIKILKPLKKEDNHYEVEQLYNQIRLNYEKSGRYHEAGDFFVGAMEMRRKGDREKKVIRKVLTLYKWISLYGERPIRAFGWLVGIWFLFGLIYLAIGLEPINIFYSEYDPIIRSVFSIKSLFTCDFWKDYYQGLLVSLDIIALGKVKPIYDLMECCLAPLMRGIQIVISATLLSLFILAMNRKFRRTKD